MADCGASKAPKRKKPSYLRGQLGILIRAVIILGLLIWLLIRLLPRLQIPPEQEPDYETIIFTAPDALDSMPIPLEPPDQIQD